VACVACEQHVPGDEVVTTGHFVKYPAGAGDMAALGVLVKERCGCDGVGGEGWEPGEDLRVDEASPWRTQARSAVGTVVRFGSDAPRSPCRRRVKKRWRMQPWRPCREALVSCFTHVFINLY
jgi:hypothetical protein